MAGDVIVYGVPATILVIALVQLIKLLFPKLKENDHAQVVLTVGVGLVLVVLAKLSDLYPLVAEWGVVLISGLLVACTAMGIYDVAHQTTKTIQTKRSTKVTAIIPPKRL